jgi:hypothetical protein
MDYSAPTLDPTTSLPDFRHSDLPLERLLVADANGNQATADARVEDVVTFSESIQV